MIKVGITGQPGFIGSHLYNYLNLKKEEIVLIPFQDSFFSDKTLLDNFVKQCDAIVHLAAMNRHGDPQVIYDTNMHLVRTLIDSCQTTNSRPHILFSSSTQEDRDNLYGKSKLDGRKLLEQWAEASDAVFTGLVIPNVFGPFGNPYYNSVVATFCHQLTHNEQPHIDVDGEMKLIYVGELVKVFYDNIIEGESGRKGEGEKGRNGEGEKGRKGEGEKGRKGEGEKGRKGEGEKGRKGDVKIIRVPHSSEKKVTEILAILQGFKTEYFEKGIFPDLSDRFVLNLFNTFVCYIDHEKFFPFNLKLNTDARGYFVETVKMRTGGQISFSVTKPGITRGNHYHSRKAERFAVVKGKAQINLRRVGTEKVITFDLNGDQPSYVDMPIWHVHNITNIGTEDVYTIFWISEFFDPNDADTFFENVEK